MASIDFHRRMFRTYKSLPGPLKRAIRTTYENYFEGSEIAPNYRQEFVETFFRDDTEFQRYADELQSLDVMDEIESARAEHLRRTGHGKFAAINTFTHPRLYALVRKLDPETVVETGVCNGVSTYIVLRALEQNGHGHLRSVDYPDPERLPRGEEPGWFIPDDSRHRWSLTKGLSQEELPEMVADVDEIELFLHDTGASIFGEELDIVWPKLASGAVIVADDIHESDVFGEVIDSRDVHYGYAAPNVGYMIKR